MRLIDADTLYEYKVQGEIGNISGDFVPGFAIDRAETLEVEPVRHGKWIYDDNAQDWGLGGYVCSECSALNHNLPHNEIIHERVFWFVGSKYCPNCGAKMGLEGE